MKLFSECILMHNFLQMVLNLDDWQEALKYGAMLLTVLFHIFATCWIGERLIHHSSRLSHYV